MTDSPKFEWKPLAGMTRADIEEMEQHFDVSCMKASLGSVLYRGVFSKSRITKAFNDNPEVFMRAVIELYREALLKPPNDDSDTVRVPA